MSHYNKNCHISYYSTSHFCSTQIMVHMCFHLQQKTSRKFEKVRLSVPVTILLYTTGFTFYSKEQKLVSFVTKPGYSTYMDGESCDLRDEELLWG